MSQKTKPILIFLLFRAISFSLFGNTIKGEFLYDDQHFYQRQDLKSIQNIKKLFTEVYLPDNMEAGLYRPLLLVSYVFNFVFFGDSIYLQARPVQVLPGVLKA